MLKGVLSSSLVSQRSWISTDLVTTSYQTWGDSPVFLDLSIALIDSSSEPQSFSISTSSSASSCSPISSASSSLVLSSSHTGHRWKTWIAGQNGHKIKILNNVSFISLQNDGMRKHFGIVLKLLMIMGKWSKWCTCSLTYPYPGRYSLDMWYYLCSCRTCLWRYRSCFWDQTFLGHHQPADGITIHSSVYLFIFYVPGSSDLPCPCVQAAGHGRNQVTALIIIRFKECYLKQVKQPLSRLADKQ